MRYERSQLLRRPEVIAFEHGDKVSARQAESAVISLGERVNPQVFLGEIPNSRIRIPADYIPCSIRGPVVDDDLFPIPMGLAEHSFNARTDEPLMVICRGDDAD
jgi:hypothetical protein